MLLSEAARTGRKFRRTTQPDIWYQLEGKAIQYVDRNVRGVPVIDAEMLVSPDWEPEPLQLTITADDLIRAARAFDDIASKRKLSAVEFAKLLCQNLGLTEEK